MKKLRQVFLLLILTSVSNTTFANDGDTLTVNPNPFHSFTVIHFEIAANDTICLDIYDITGRIVKTYFNANILPSGSYSINFKGDTLPNGVYFLRLKINSKIFVKKLVKTDALVDVTEHVFHKSTILLYPNPTTETLEIPIDGIKTIVVTDLNGRIVIHSLIQTKSISLSNLENGSYIVTVLSEANQLITTQHIIKASN